MIARARRDVNWAVWVGAILALVVVWGAVIWALMRVWNRDASWS